MKQTNKLLAALIATVVMVSSAMAQAPQKMSYQSVIRNTSGALVANQAVGVKISLLQGSATGTAVYVETQNPTTNANGLASFQIGGGTVVSGSFASINWAAGPYFVKTETDPTGGSNYSIAGTTQLLSVAYALYAANSGTPGPAGATGAKGDKGDTGAQGIQGVQGATGATGATGAKGDKGDTGAQGIQGEQGATGLTGIQGPAGAIGVKGDSGVSVRNTVVNGDSLFVTLSSGKIINVGNVRGLQGVGVDSVSVVNDTLITYKSNGTTVKAAYTSNASKGIRKGFANSTNWICPAGVTQVTVELWGGGGGWGVYVNARGYTSTTNGGNGGYNKQISNVIPGQSYKIIVGGAGGTTFSFTKLNAVIPGNSAYFDGIPGGVSSFNTTISAQGGGIGGISNPQGVNGNITNWSIPTSDISQPQPDYIPSPYIVGLSYPIRVANGGLVGALTLQEVQAAESGYVVISY
jgi:hypothetical protein